MQTLKRKQESLISKCDDTSAKLKRLRSSEHHNLQKIKHLEKQTIVQPDASSSQASSLLTDKERKEYQRLTNRLVEVENENEMLNSRFEELESEKVEIFDYSTNQFKENVQKCVHKLLEHNVSSTQIPNVIQAWLDLAGKEADHALPSVSTIRKMNLQRGVISSMQIAESLPKGLNFSHR